MMGPTHRLTGGLAGVAYAAATGQPWSVVAMSGVIASASAHGFLSPDVDQTKPWVAVRKLLPGSIDQVLNHRTGLSHWWGLVPLAWWGIQQMTPLAGFLATLLLVGWASHLVGDFIFGELALLPGGGPTFGLGLDTGGRLEHHIVAPLIGVAIVVLLIHTHNPDVADHLARSVPR
jgi:hypothetical protein